jgi:hemerythrin-like domain-containing protein
LANHRGMDSGVGVVDLFIADHRRMREQCRQLEVFTTGGGDDVFGADVRDKFEQLIHYFDVEARNHHQHEETILFPRLLAIPLDDADRKQLMSLVDALVLDHHELDRLWLDVRDESKASLRNFGQSANRRVAPPIAANVATFVTLNLHHVNREETGIIPLVGSRFSNEELNNMQAEIAARNAAGLH